MLKREIIIVLVAVILLSGIVLAQTFLVKSNDPKLYLSLGDFLLKNNNPEKALSAYNKALELDPTNKAVLNNLGYYYKDSNPLLAEDYFKRALEADNECDTARNNLALLYNKMGQYDKAVEQLRILVKNNPDSIHYIYDLAINLANKFYYQGKLYDDLVESIKYFKMSYDKQPNFEHSLDNIKVLEEIRKLINNN